MFEPTVTMALYQYTEQAENRKRLQEKVDALEMSVARGETTICSLVSLANKATSMHLSAALRSSFMQIVRDYQNAETAHLA